jgi:hypothetical protein
MSEITTPRAVLENFFAEMKSWEQDFFEEKMLLVNSGQPTAACNEKYKKILEVLLQKYSMRNGKSWDRLDAPGCGEPTMYDPRRDSIEELQKTENSASFIVTQAVGLEAVFRFTLLKESGFWRIKKKETHRSGKWQASVL